MPEYVIGALIGVGGTLLGILFGSIISYKYSVDLIKRTEFIKACAEFKIAFSEIVFWLNYEAVSDSIRTPGKLKDSHKRHFEAINRFNAIMPEKSRTDFKIACDNFYNKKDNQYYIGYTNLDTSPERKESRELALNNINKLLEFAEY